MAAQERPEEVALQGRSRVLRDETRLVYITVARSVRFGDFHAYELALRRSWSLRRTCVGYRS